MTDKIPTNAFDLGNPAQKIQDFCTERGCTLVADECYELVQIVLSNNPDYYIIKKSDVQALTCHPDEKVSVPYLQWEVLKATLITQSDPDIVRIPRKVLEGNDE